MNLHHPSLICLFLIISSLCSAQGVSINQNGASPDPSAALDVSSATQGVLLPRLSTSQRDAITTPAEGLLIYNISTHCFEAYVNSSWGNVSCPTPCAPTSTPVAATHQASTTQIVWNWSEVPGLIGYKWNATNNYPTAIDLGTTHSYTQSGLACGTSQTAYVWAYNSCGVSAPLTLSQSTSYCCGEEITFTYNGTAVTYGTVINAGKCWLDRNLGALSAATSSSDPDAYGDLFQWGRLDDGHQVRTSNLSASTSSTDIPGNADFYIPNVIPYDWRSPQNDNLWQGSTGVNNPCPSGWRVPTSANWTAEMATWSGLSADGAFGSPLKLVTAGARYNDGSIGGTSDGHYWSSTWDYDFMNQTPGAEGFGSAYELIFSSDDAFMDPSYWRGFGLSVRCLTDL